MSALIKHNGVEYRVEGDEWGLRRCDPEPGDDADYEAVVRKHGRLLAATRGTEAMPGARAYEAWKESRNLYAA